MESILITGGLGFIGHHLSLYLNKQGFDVKVIDNYSHKIQQKWHRKIIDERIRLIQQADISVIQGDTTDEKNVEQILLDKNPNKIIHLAAIPSAIYSNKDPSASFDQNLLATKILLECIRKYGLGVTQFTYFSSSMVYGDFKSDSVTEESPVNPKGMYGTAKLCSELLLKAYHNLTGLNYTIIRPSALYGPRCINNRVTQVFIERAIQGKEIRIQGDGSQQLDFTFINDLIQGVSLVQKKPEAYNRIFNITTGKAEPIIRLIHILKDYFPYLNVSFEKWDDIIPQRGTLCINSARALGYKPEYTLDVGYRKYIEWYTDNNIISE